MSSIIEQKQSTGGVLLKSCSKKFQLCQILFFNQVAGLRPATLLKKETLAQVFSCKFCEISKSTFFTERLWWLLLIEKHLRCMIFQQSFCLKIFSFMKKLVASTVYMTSPETVNLQSCQLCSI